ncbi:MAG: DUF1501 domain-containing protein [Gemmataceae bacterium]|nr:DUF1501 domain-containing protein [Gemmataceae bacterium]MCI0739294.1 DUF1501 domain-containing protein [Gemmataceae bacterium]
MLVIPGDRGKATCDGMTRRELLRVGGSALLGITLADIFKLQASADPPATNGGPGWNRAKSVIMIYLQGGPSHLDLWDPKDNVPERVRSTFSAINTCLPGVHFTELLPRLSRVLDKTTLLRTISYTPVGLFNHTAAIYQMLTGYQADAVSPSGQLEPPTPRDYPHFGCQIARLRPPTEPTLPFVMMPRPLQESNVVNKGGTAGFLGRAYDPYYLFPAGDDMDMNKMDRISVDDLALRPEISNDRLQRRGRLRDQLAAGMPDLERAVARYDLPTYYTAALNLVLSGRARNAFNLEQEPTQIRERYGRNTFGQCLLLARRLVEAGTRVVEVNWPKVANSDNHSWDVHTDLPSRMRRQSAPMLDAGLSGLITDLDDRGLLNDTLVLAVGEFGRSPLRGVSTSGNSNSADGRDHWPYCYTGLIAGGGVKRGFVWGRSDNTASAPLDNPVHPRDLLATIYHSVGINPHQIMYNHLNQPRELVQGEVVNGILQ